MIVWHSPCESRTPPNYLTLKDDGISQNKLIAQYQKAPNGAFLLCGIRFTIKPSMVIIPDFESTLGRKYPLASKSLKAVLLTHSELTK